MDIPRKVADPAHSQLNKTNTAFSLSPFSRENLVSARRVRLSRPASVRSIVTLRLNLMLPHGIISAFRDGDHLYRKLPWGQSRVYRVTSAYRWYSQPRVRWHKTSLQGGSIVLLTGAAFQVHHELVSVRLAFSTPTSGM